MLEMGGLETTRRICARTMCLAARMDNYISKSMKIEVDGNQE